jgi:lipopolysaccharide/colanic/teichoic acid biosynthesis glycosyltransferase
VPVGLTGLAQVNGLRGDTSIDERAWFDNHYIDNWSMGHDLVILARTGGAVIKQARNKLTVPDGAPRGSACRSTPSARC